MLVFTSLDCEKNMTKINMFCLFMVHDVYTVLNRYDQMILVLYACHNDDK